MKKTKKIDINNLTKSDLIKMMKSIGKDEDEIETFFYEMDFFKNLRPITVKELQNFTQKELDKLISYCWHDGRPRCDCVGIDSLTVKINDNGLIEISYSDGNGDPDFDFYGDENTEIKNLGNGEWNYGLFIKVKNK